MIRLIVLDQQNNTQQELDTFGSENVALTLQVDDVRNIENKNASYSKEFNLPATKRNNKFFEHYYDLNRYNTNFNAYRNLKAFLYVDDVLVLEGFMRLINVLDKSTEISYTVVLFNDVANIIETLADATISDLDFTDINHQFSPSNIILSWNDDEVPLTAGGTTNDVYYPLINDGQIYTDDSKIYIDHNKHYVLNLSLKYVLDKIFEYAGFSYLSSFFTSSPFTDIYFDIGDESVNETPSLVITADTGSGTDAIGVNSGTDIGNSFYNATAIDFVNETGDTDGDFDHDTSVFTAPYDCNVNVSYTVAVGNEEEFMYGILMLHAFIDGESFLIGGTYVQEAPSAGSVYIVTHTFTGTVYAEEGQTITFKWSRIGAPLMIYNSYTTIPTIELNVFNTATSGKIIAHRGDIKLADILKDIVTMFNLTLESRGNNTIVIEPYNDFISSGIELDWTNKVNINEHIIETLEIPRRIELNHAKEDDDYYHKQYKSIHNIMYGTQRLEFDVDSTDVLNIELSVFSAPFIKELDNTNINLQHRAKQDGNEFVSFDNKPRLIFKNPNGFDIDYIVYDINEGETFGAGYTTINNGTHFDGSDDSNPPIPQLTADDNSLLFGYINPTYIPTIGAQPLNTFYFKYWYDFLNEKYNVTNGILLKCEANLKPTDILNFSFANKVRIQDQIYRVNKIEYNTDRTSLAKVELLRI